MQQPNKADTRARTEVMTTSFHACARIVGFAMMSTTTSFARLRREVAGRRCFQLMAVGADSLIVDAASSDRNARRKRLIGNLQALLAVFQLHLQLRQVVTAKLQEILFLCVSQLEVAQLVFVIDDRCTTHAIVKCLLNCFRRKITHHRCVFRGGKSKP